MYTLLSDIYSVYTRRDTYAVLLLGLDNAGKSTLLESLKHHYAKPSPHPTSTGPTTGTTTGTGTESSHRLSLADIRPTIGQNIAKLSVSGTDLHLWDLGGQETLRSMWPRYYAESHLILYVIDSSSRERLAESMRVLDEMASDPALAAPVDAAREPSTRNARGVGDDDDHDHDDREDDLETGQLAIPILIVANKQDVEGALEVAEVKEHCNARVARIGAIEGGVVPCSALLGTGVGDVGDWIRTRVLRNKHQRPPTVR